MHKISVRGLSKLYNYFNYISLKYKLINFRLFTLLLKYLVFVLKISAVVL